MRQVVNGDQSTYGAAIQERYSGNSHESVSVAEGPVARQTFDFRSVNRFATTRLPAVLEAMTVARSDAHVGHDSEI